MYSPPSSYKKQTVKQVLIYAFMTFSVVSIVFILVLFTLGYRFNRAEGVLEQGGLVQLNSIPSGAALTINGARLSGTTSTRTTLPAGEYTIAMSREGYATWQKTVEVERGTVLWLNYARLIPEELPVEDVLELPAVTSTLASPNRRWLAITTDPATAAISLVDIDADQPELATLRLPVSAYSIPQSETPNERFRVTAWDPSSRYVLVEHRYDDTSEWIVVDTEDTAESKNMTTIFNVPMTNVEFSRTNSRLLYALMDGDVRKIDLDASTISAPLVRNVAEFSLFDQATIVYTTTADSRTGNRSVGYVQDGASEPRVIRSYSDEGEAPLHISIDKYYNQTFVAIAYGNSVEVLKGSLPRSDASDPLTLTTVTTVATPESIDYLSSKTDGRFFVAQHGQSYTVYDFELEKATTTPLRGESRLTGELRWIDGYTVWSGLDGTLRLYEFDGANQHDIMPIVQGQVPALTSNNRYMYAPTRSDSGEYYLSRVRLVLP